MTALKSTRGPALGNGTGEQRATSLLRLRTDLNSKSMQVLMPPKRMRSVNACSLRDARSTPMNSTIWFPTPATPPERHAKDMEHSLLLPL